VRGEHVLSVRVQDDGSGVGGLAQDHRLKWAGPSRILAAAADGMKAAG